MDKPTIKEEGEYVMDEINRRLSKTEEEIKSIRTELAVNSNLTERSVSTMENLSKTMLDVQLAMTKMVGNMESTDKAIGKLDKKMDALETKVDAIEDKSKFDIMGWIKDNIIIIIILVTVGAMYFKKFI